MRQSRHRAITISTKNQPQGQVQPRAVGGEGSVPLCKSNVPSASVMAGWAGARIGGLATLRRVRRQRTSEDCRHLPPPARAQLTAREQCSAAQCSPVGGGAVLGSGVRPLVSLSSLHGTRQAAGPSSCTISSPQGAGQAGADAVHCAPDGPRLLLGRRHRRRRAEAATGASGAGERVLVLQLGGALLPCAILVRTGPLPRQCLVPLVLILLRAP